MNVRNLGKGDSDELDKIMKSVLWREGFHGRQSNDERLYSKRKESGRGLKSFKEVYHETKSKVGTEKQFNTFCLDARSWQGQSMSNDMNNTLKVLAVKRAIENGLLPEETKWYAVN